MLLQVQHLLCFIRRRTTVLLWLYREYFHLHNLAKSDNIVSNTTIVTSYYWIVVNKYHICYWSVFKKCWEVTSCSPTRVITDKLSEKKESHVLEKKKKKKKKKKSPTDFQICYIVTTFYFEDLDRNVVEWKVQYLTFKCSEVKVISFQKKEYSSKVQILKKCT